VVMQHLIIANGHRSVKPKAQAQGRSQKKSWGENCLTLGNRCKLMVEARKHSLDRSTTKGF